MELGKVKGQCLRNGTVINLPCNWNFDGWCGMCCQPCYVKDVTRNAN